MLRCSMGGFMRVPPWSDFMRFLGKDPVGLEDLGLRVP